MRFVSVIGHPDIIWEYDDWFLAHTIHGTGVFTYIYPSMYGIFTYIDLFTIKINYSGIGKYTIRPMDPSWVGVI